MFMSDVCTVGFEEHSGRFYDSAKHENGIPNHIVMLQAPKDDFLTERPSSVSGKGMKSVEFVADSFIDTKMPESLGVNLSYLEGRVNFGFEESSSIALKIEEQLVIQSR